MHMSKSRSLEENLPPPQKKKKKDTEDLHLTIFSKNIASFAFHKDSFLSTAFIHVRHGKLMFVYKIKFDCQFDARVCKNVSI